MTPSPAASTAAPRRRFLVIHNPMAGARRVLRLHEAVEALRQRYGAEVTVRTTAARGDAEAMARALAPGAFDAVAVAGGDGTVNEAINGLAARGPQAAGIPLGLVPLGTANVLVHELGLPLEPGAIADALAIGRVMPIHFGVANGRCFAMMAGAGLDARVVAGVSSRLKRLIGKGAYVAETLRQLAVPGGQRYHVEIDGKRWEVAAVIAAKGRFYGGRFVCAPLASLSEPRLHVCLFERPGRWNAMRYIRGVAAGRLTRLPDVRIVSAERLFVTGPVGDPVQGDGDVITHLPVEIAVSPWTLPVLGPP